MDKIKNQASKVSDLVFSPETGATYQKTLTLTWSILRETGTLLWLIVCLTFVGGEWFWKKSIVLGRNTRDWYEGLNAPKTSEPKSAGEMGQSLLSVIGTSTENLIYQAKQQLGIEAEPPAPKSLSGQSAGAATTGAMQVNPPSMPTVSQTQTPVSFIDEASIKVDPSTQNSDAE